MPNRSGHPIPWHGTVLSISLFGIGCVGAIAVVLWIPFMLLGAVSVSGHTRAATVDGVAGAGWALGACSLLVHVRWSGRRWLSLVMFAGLTGVLALLAAAAQPKSLMMVILATAVGHALLLAARFGLGQASRYSDWAFWRDRRLARGLCPYCLYDIRNLPVQRCPECGATWEEGGQTSSPITRR